MLPYRSYREDEVNFLHCLKVKIESRSDVALSKLSERFSKFLILFQSQKLNTRVMLPYGSYRQDLVNLLHCFKVKIESTSDVALSKLFKIN